MSAILTGKYIPTLCSIHTIAQKVFCSNFCCIGRFHYFFIFSCSSHLMRWILSGKPISQSSRFLEYSWLSCGSCKKQWKNETCWHANFYDVCDETNRIMMRPPLNLLQDTLPVDCLQRILNRMDERSRQEASQKDNSLWTWISSIKNKMNWNPPRALVAQLAESLGGILLTLFRFLVYWPAKSQGVIPTKPTFSTNAVPEIGRVSRITRTSESGSKVMFLNVFFQNFLLNVCFFFLPIRERNRYESILGAAEDKLTKTESIFPIDVWSSSSTSHLLWTDML